MKRKRKICFQKGGIDLIRRKSLKIIIIYGNDTLIFDNKVEFRLQKCEFLNIGIGGVENHT